MILKNALSMTVLALLSAGRLAAQEAAKEPAPQATPANRGP